MRILITGGAGFIGSHLAEHFQRHAAVRVLDDLRTGHRSNLAGLDVEFVQGSILDRTMVNRAMQDVDYVYHLAAFVSAPQSILDPHTCVKLNVTGLLNVLEAAATTGVRKLCFSSSAAVYGIWGQRYCAEARGYVSRALQPVCCDQARRRVLLSAVQ
jgi:UDP-glucose 4-epimerase